MKHVLKASLVSLIMVGALVGSAPVVMAENTDPPHVGKITGRSVAAGLLSFLIWPGIGQAVNSDKGDKVITHVVIGLLPPFRFWSGYDGLFNRKGGYWNGKV